MERISTNMPNDDVQYYLRRKEQGIASIQAKIANQTRIRELADDPLAASHAVRYSSYLTRLERFETNTQRAREHYKHVDDHMGQANDILQRLRELAVQGANGIYTAEDNRAMAVEVNELVKELGTIANATSPDGSYIFAGDKSFTAPFRIVEGTVNGLDGPAPVEFEYRGAGAHRRTEITDRTYADLDIAGGHAFWAERMQAISSFDASTYQVQENAAIFIDGVEIQLHVGDNVRTIAAKINDSAAPVKAYIDRDTQGLALEGLDAHLITLEDAEGSQVLRDLGLIRGNSLQGAPNWDPSAQISGGSIFEVAIGLRDALLRGDSAYVGGQGLGGMDQALANVNARRAVVGSRQERVESTWSRLNREIQDVNETLSREAGLDLASAAMEFGMMDMSHKAALQTAARILPQTLLDFLR
ncbi:MAG: flagellar hook-associated protein 3 [Spirochaetaceae bacterium]|jgi:flagellar hook-associated protein 3 FlgL|nr:flagellar hook-associated protein 3 [Spirochaetaceae bacterium]